MRLAGDGVGNLGAAVSDIDAIEAGEGVDQLATLGIADAYAAGCLDDGRRDGAGGEIGDVGGGMQDGGTVLLPQRLQRLLRLGSN